MADLEVVHLSDLHWDSAKATNTQIVVKPLLEDLRIIREEGLIKPDILVFTGDLVNAGENLQEFEDAYDGFIGPALEALRLDKDQVFLCPGNHDIARSSVREAGFIEAGIKSSLTSVDTTNEFLDRLKKQNLSDLMVVERMDNYYSFVKKYFAVPTILARSSGFGKLRSMG